MNLLFPLPLVRNEVANKDLLVYAAVYKILKKSKYNETFLSVSDLIAMIYGDQKISKGTRTSTVVTLESLIENGYVAGKRTNKFTFEINKSTLLVKAPFVIIRDDEYLKIKDSAGKSQNTLLRVFAVTISTLSNRTTVDPPNMKPKKGVVGFYTQDALGQLIGMTSETIRNHNSKLESLDLLYINRADDVTTTKNEGGFAQLSNVYGRPENQKYIDHYAGRRKDITKAHKYTAKKAQTKKPYRSLAAKYGHLSRGKDYSQEDAKAIYDYVVEHNKKCMDEYEKSNSDYYLSKLYDLSPFAKYGLPTDATPSPVATAGPAPFYNSEPEQEIPDAAYQVYLEWLQEPLSQPSTHNNENEQEVWKKLWPDYEDSYDEDEEMPF